MAQFDKIELSEYDFKQIRLMSKKIESFEEHKLALHRLINDLRDLLNTLESVNESWKRTIQTEINTLELIEECFNDGTISLWDENPTTVEKNSLLEIKKQTKFIIISYLQQPNFSIKLRAQIIDGNWLLCPNCQEAWELLSSDAMVICPKCDQILHNPHYLKMET